LCLRRREQFCHTFITPIGRFRWLRLPFGLKISSEIFQRVLSRALENLEGVFNVADDVLICGCGETVKEAERDLSNKMLRFLERYLKQRIKLNKSKAELNKTKQEFLDHVITADGLETDLRKVEAIALMPRPKDPTEVRQFCRAISYLARFALVYLTY